jgi:hypothetical protein
MNNLSGAILSSKQPSTVIRTGSIVGGPLVGETTCLVSIGGTVVEAGVIEHYIPNVGDMVAVAKQDSSWLVIGAIQRTEWIPFVLSSGFIHETTGAVPAYRVIGNQVYWRGRVRAASGTIPNASVLFIVPTAIRPMDSATVSHGWAVARSSTTGVSAATRIDIVAGTGVVRPFDTSSTLPSWVELTNVQYFLN